ncbi:hypothetical protein ACHAWF_018928 [Thalassiosira exigua]
MSEFSWKQKWLAITPKPFATLSVIGSLYIIRHVLTSQTRRSAVFHRILLGLSIYDVMTSITVFMGTWPIPRGSPGIFMASGTNGTCSAQGFFIQFAGVGAPIYNASLATYYFLIVVRGWKEHQLKKAEPLLHFVPISFSLCTGILAAAKKLYGNSVLWCWITSSNDAYRLGLFYAPIWASMITVTVLMAAMCVHVVGQERKSKIYRRPEASIIGTRLPGESTVSRRSTISTQDGANARARESMSRKVTTQAMFYVFSFYLTWIFPSWTRMSQMINGSSPFYAIALFTIFLPLQGYESIMFLTIILIGMAANYIFSFVFLNYFAQLVQFHGVFPTSLSEVPPGKSRIQYLSGLPPILAPVFNQTIYY